MKILKKLVRKPSETFTTSSNDVNVQSIPRNIKSSNVIKIKKENVVSDETKDRRVDALAKARAERKLRQDAGEEFTRRNPWEIWEEDKTSLRKCVNANCYECCGEEGYTTLIRYCNIFTCAFWLVRPYGKGITKERVCQWDQEQIVRNGKEKDVEDIPEGIE